MSSPPSGMGSPEAVFSIFPRPFRGLWKGRYGAGGTSLPLEGWQTCSGPSPEPENYGPAGACSELGLREPQAGQVWQVAWGCACLFLPPALVCIHPAGWKLLAMLALFLAVMVWYSISREDKYIEL